MARLNLHSFFDARARHLTFLCGGPGIGGEAWVGGCSIDEFLGAWRRGFRRILREAIRMMEWVFFIFIGEAFYRLIGKIAILMVG
jgi:hypothetical protein